MSKTELDPYKYFEKYLKDCGTLVDTDLERYLNIDDSRDLSDTISAINYSIFSGGKRVRPFLLIAISDMLGVSRELSVKFSAVVEMIHTYSLIHDDLPALDNDDLRRGQLSCHKKFGEATAILAGDALLNRAIEVCLIKDDELDDEKRIKIMQEIFRATSIKGLLGGQILDINADKKKTVDLEDLDRINNMKTGALFSICAKIPFILCENPDHEKFRPRVEMYIKSLSSAFQVADDIDDYEKDKLKGKENANIAHMTSIEHAKHELEILTNQAIEMVQSIKIDCSDLLVQFAKFLNKHING